MDLSKFLQAKPVIVKVLDATKDYSPERPGFWKLDCQLESGDTTFIVLSQSEVDSLPSMKGDYANLGSVAKIATWRKNGKSGQYLERLKALPPLKKKSSGDWINPWEAEAKKPKP